MNGKRFSGENARRSGFYLALAVCLVAVGIAAWSTYDAVNSTIAPESTSSHGTERAESVSFNVGRITMIGISFCFVSMILG